MTVLIPLASAKNPGLLFNWPTASRAFVKFADEGGARLWLVDVFVAAVGPGFFLLGYHLY